MSAKDLIFIDLMERSIEASGPIWYVLKQDYEKLCGLASRWAAMNHTMHVSDPFGPRAISLSDARMLIASARDRIVDRFTHTIESS